MTGRELFLEIGNIREEYVTEAENYRSKTKGSILAVSSGKSVKSVTFRKTLATAACLVVCAGIVFTVQKLGVTKEAAEESVVDNQMGMEYAREEQIDTSLKMEGSIVLDTETNSESEVLVKENEEKDEPSTADAVEEKEWIVLGESQSALNLEHGVWDLKAVKKRMSSYPDDYDEILKLDNVFILVHGTAEKGQNLWDAFLEAVDDGKAAQVEVIQFTVEGDPIIETVYYDGEVFHLCVDHSRDAYRGNGDAYFEANYSLLTKEENPLDAGGRTVEYSLTDGENEYIIAYIVE